MIKIEYIPRPPKVKQYRAHCKCGCIFTFNEEDKYTKCFGHGDFWRIISCPHCGNDIGTLWDESTVEEI